MPTSAIFLLLLSFLLALAFALFQYFYKAKKRGSKNVIFASLRFIAVFGILLLLINPEITRTEYYNQKPNLVVAVDNSSSIAEFGAGEEVKRFVGALQTDPELQNNFDIETYSFDRKLQQVDSLTFSGSQTNLPAVFKDLSNLYETKMSPVLLITDGNQTLGEEFTFAANRFKQPILPVVVGDTARFQDLGISRINVNKYAFLNNRFPVEIMTNYSGNTSAETQLEIRKGNTIIQSIPLTFSPEKNSEVVRLEIPANAVGVHNYEVRLQPLEAEKNAVNNSREFVIQVIDERTKVLIAYSVLHPDLGAFKKAIESNQQREVELRQIADLSDVEEFQLVILYQPDLRFKSLMDQLQSQNRNYFLITGKNSNWDFLNKQQETFQHEITNQSEEYFPVWNENFKAFQAEDIGYNDFPPLEGNFGNLEVSGNVDVLLYKEVQGVETTLPLMGIATAGDSKVAFLMGSDIWRWRGVVFRETGSFQKFDELIGKIVQLLASKQRQERLVVNYEPLYSGSEGVLITADYFDQSYNFDPRANLSLQIENLETGELRQVPFLLDENSFRVDLSSLPAGDYNFNVSVAGENISRSGSFRILNFDVEKQFVRANLEGLEQIAAQKGQEVYFLRDFQKLKNELLSSNSYATVQKSRQKDVSLIDWKYLLAIILFALSTEWFLRKYYGLI